MKWFIILFFFFNCHNWSALGANIQSALCKIPTKQHIPAPVFDAGENLSCKGCGLWNNGYHEFAPWSVSIVRSDGRADCPAILVSPTTIISEGCSDDYEDYKDYEVSYIAHLGECYRHRTSNDSCTSQNNGMKKNIISATKLSTVAFNSNPLHLWKINAIADFKPNDYIRPVCLFNKDATRDFDTSQIYTSLFQPRGSKRTAQIVQVKECLGYAIDANECSRLNNAFCVHFEDEPKQNILYHVQNERYFLRGIKHYSYIPDYTLFFDILPLTREIVLQSARDLYMMPVVPIVKERVAFHKGFSFPGCGTTLQQDRRRRSSDEKLKAIPLIFNGTRSTRGFAPWHASLTLYFSREEWPDVCGGSLISQQAVLTAAHCVTPNGGRLNPQQILVTLGLYNRFYREDSSIQSKYANEILVHPYYKQPGEATTNYESFENDVAIILFRDNFQITNFVRPICLWNSDYHLSTIVNKNGEVNGWGLNAENLQPETLQKAVLPVRTYWDCYLENKDFFSLHLKPGINFCAGKNGTSACNGDSGGGFVIRKEQTWFIRGIVSLGVVKKKRNNDGEMEKNSCDERFSSVYTDLASYMKWIAQNVPDISRYYVTL